LESSPELLKKAFTVVRARCGRVKAPRAASWIFGRVAAAPRAGVRADVARVADARGATVNVARIVDASMSCVACGTDAEAGDDDGEVIFFSSLDKGGGETRGGGETWRRDDAWW
jgi:hypothetical protein